MNRSVRGIPLCFVQSLIDFLDDDSVDGEGDSDYERSDESDSDEQDGWEHDEQEQDDLEDVAQDAEMEIEGDFEWVSHYIRHSLN